MSFVSSSRTQKTPVAIMFATFAQISWITILLCSSPTSSAQYKPPLFVFGDSLYDGGMTWYNGVRGAGAEFWPYGETYFKKPSGRYSDGRLIPDFIAQYAGLPFLRPYLLPGLKDFTKGINFASAGSCVRVETRPSTINLKRQVEYFVEMVHKLKQQVGEAQANQLLSEAVYLFNIGGNDYVSLLARNVKKLPLSNSIKDRAWNEIVGNLSIHIKTVYNQGGRKFLFQNIGPLGCLPTIKVILGFEGTCAPEPQEIAKEHNNRFASLAKRLRKQLPGFKYSIYDFYTSLYVRVLYGSRYGFKESQIACCGSGPFNGAFNCQKMDTSFSVCSNSNDYLWFDAGHPTEKANKQFASELWVGGPNVVAPYNLQTLLSMT